MKAFTNYLKIDGKVLPLADSFVISLEDVTGDSSGTTEAGTSFVDIIRKGVAHITATYSVSAKWLSVLSTFYQKGKVTAEYFNSQELDLKETEMIFESFKIKLCHDTSKKGLWQVSFELKEI